MRSWLVAPSVLLLACAGAPQRPAPATPEPIARPEEIVILPDTLLGPWPRSYVGLRLDGTNRMPTGAVLIAAFVVDTLGRVERASVRFLETTPTDMPQYFLSVIEREYQEGVCGYLGRSRFTPARIDGRLRRALILGAFVFSRAYMGYDTRLDKHAESMSQATPEEVFEYLNGLPAC